MTLEHEIHAHGSGAAEAELVLDPPSRDAQIADLEARIVLRVPLEAHYLGAEDFTRLSGTATTQEIGAMTNQLRVLRETRMAPGIGEWAIAS